MSTSCVLYVGAIPYNWDVEIIKSVVCGSGPIVDVRCMMDNISKNKGFCFVEYSTPTDASIALNLLSKIKIEGNRKKIRVELSKEGLRNSMHLNKPTLKLNRLLLPTNVKLPLEMTQYDSNIDVFDSIENDEVCKSNPILKNLKLTLATNQEKRQMVSQMIANGMDLIQISNIISQFNNNDNNNNSNNSNNNNNDNIGNLNNSNNINNNNKGLPPIPLQSQQNIINSPSINTNKHLDASKFLPIPTQPMQNSLSTDAISKTLSTIPPGVLIELLSKLKLTLSNPSPNNFQEATMILQENPKLAIAAAQALLLMGIIDTNVIVNAQSNPIPITQVSPLQSNSNSATPVTSFNNTNTNINTNINTSTNTNTNASTNMMMNAPIPNNNIINSTAPPIPHEWLSLPQQTISKLLLLQPNEANLVTQVLLLSPQQLAVLPDNERAMALQIRQQYL